MSKIEEKNQLIQQIKEFDPEFDLKNKRSFFNSFFKACENGNLKIVNALVKITNGSFRDQMIHASNDASFKSSAWNGHLHIMERLLDLTRDAQTREQMIHIDTDYAFTRAAYNGDLHMMERLLDLTLNDQTREQMIHAENDFAFREAAGNGHLDIIKLLLELTPDAQTKEQMIHTENDYAFKEAARNGHMHVVERLLDLTRNAQAREQMIHASDDYAFTRAAENGHMHIIERLFELTPDAQTREQMIHAENDYAFKWASVAGNLEMLIALITISREDNFDIEMIRQAQQHIVDKWPNQFKNVESVNYMIDIFSSLKNECGFSFSKISNLNKFVRDIKELMRSCKDPINSFVSNTGLPHNVIIHALALNNGFRYKETTFIVKTIQKVNLEAADKASMSIPSKVIDLFRKTSLSNENHSPTQGKMKFVDRLHAELKETRVSSL